MSFFKLMIAFNTYSTVEPLSRGHFRATYCVPCREAVLFSEVDNLYVLTPYTSTLLKILSVLCKEVVSFSEGPFNRVEQFSIGCLTSIVLKMLSGSHDVNDP